jgi:hypothetical protein
LTVFLLPKKEIKKIFINQAGKGDLNKKSLNYWALVLKSLVYFTDVIKEPIKFKNGRNIDFSTIKKFIEIEVRKI